MDFMYEGRYAGVLLHPTSLPSKCGIVGDLGASALPFLAYLKEAGFSYWQVLPVGPCTYSESQPGCPYLSSSSFALNPLLVCPVGLISLGLVTEQQVEELVEKWRVEQQQRRQKNIELNSDSESDFTSFVDFHVAKGYKDELLALAFETFNKMTPSAEYEEFLKSNKFWLDGYVIFEAIQARHPQASSWLEWPEEYRSYRSLLKNKPLLQNLETIEERQTPDICENACPIVQLLPKFHCFVQFVLAQQWSQLRQHANKNGIKIVGDIAFYVNMHSSDAWSNSEMFEIDSASNTPLYVSGVPPDYFSAEGQLWGHPVYAWDAHARTNFIWWTRRLASSFEKFDACRLDHFRGFESYWRVPYEFAVKHKSAKEGEWVQGPGRKLFDAVFKNMGWENPRINVASAYSEALAKSSKKASIKKWLARFHNKGSAANALLTNNSGAQHSSMPQLRGHIVRSAPLLIAEDLGFITPEIVALRDRYSIFSMRVMQFAWDDEEKGLRCEHLPYNHTRDCVVYTGLKEEPPASSIHSVLSLLALLSVAYLVILPVQDILGLDDHSRFNLPGVDSPKNWSWKLNTLEGLYAEENLHPLRHMLTLSNRCSN
ncbi:uncharacterized protein LOC34618623 [Cyclospora cayetanensis]|uniref:4-alpha-glucanotransferase n=1 Tax=Cyclospora cayetanensis TaxID=88456 RepID=A0A6P6S167_9EIME|nr:uncharacterized protein LOC34618623 [Cyclospora cayetanensis]